MVQFNLLPDVKLEFIKATYRRRIITFICIIITAAALFIFIMMFAFVRVNQTAQLRDLDGDIKTNVDKLRENPDLDKILTVQNQLATLPGKHESKVMSSRFFEYLAVLSPENNSITNAEVDFEAKTIDLTGEADSVVTLNKFVDTLKFAKFKLEADPPVDGKAFNSVVLSNLTINNSTTSKDAKNISYKLSFSYDENIFKNTASNGNPINNSVQLIVPSIISTDSEQQKPTSSLQQNGGNQ